MGRAYKGCVRRAEDQRDVARKLAGGGVLEREQVLRSEVQLSESLRLLASWGTDATQAGASVWTP